ncbi:hypothetical protein, partial [Escherichia coli]|uniref:hypothetical protein n=1 Tax=Escherichia coli TaxID=562 RepID=UPI0020C03764
LFLVATTSTSTSTSPAIPFTSSALSLLCIVIPLNRHRSTAFLSVTSAISTAGRAIHHRRMIAAHHHFRHL